MEDILKKLPDLENGIDNHLNINISYRIKKNSNKPYLVFLHGYNGSSKSWVFQFEYFSKYYSVLAIDFPGFGASSPIKNIDMNIVSNLYIRLFDRLGIDKFSLIGHSMGGMLGQVIASYYPSKINKLVLSCTHQGFAMSFRKPLRDPYFKRLDERKKMSDDEFGKLRAQNMVPHLKNKSILKMLSRISSEISINSILCGGEAMQILDTTELLEKIICPSLIISASEDIVCNEGNAVFLNQKIKNSIRFNIEDAGHAPYCEKPELFNETVHQFLK